MPNPFLDPDKKPKSWCRSLLPVTKADLLLLENKLMAAIQDFATAVNAKFDKLSSDLDAVVTGIKALDDLIRQLQNSPGTISPADQALLDQIQARSGDLVTKADAIDTTPPAPPPTP